MWSARQAIEVFHLLFLRSFGARVDKTLFALKGGCNLRFYHRSIRYSEDMDLDLRTMAPGTLRSNVEAVFAADPFRHSLRAQGLEISTVTAPKQTSTTQRWKLALRLADQRDTIPTKIEFSRRALDAGAEIAPVEPELIRRYKLYPVLVQRYGAPAAFAQKVAALALRTETQARDLFDLKLLLDTGATPPAISPELVSAAIENAMKIGFDDFTGQVAAYLEPEHQADYRGHAPFDRLQQQVIDALQALPP